MTNQPTHDEVIAWIDEQLNEGYPAQGAYRASLLANRDVLERHKSTLDGVCMGCSDFTRFSKGLGAPHKVMFPCPTYQDIYNRIREVM
jgi:hypothetical protein